MQSNAKHWWSQWTMPTMIMLTLLISMDMHNACTLLISMDHSKYCGTVNFNVVEPPWSNVPKSALQPHLKLVTAASHVHAFWEGDSSMEHRCGRTRRWWGHGPRKNKLHFFRKDGFISIGFGNINAILIFCLVWYWVLFPEEFTTGQLFDGVEKENHFTLKLW